MFKVGKSRGNDGCKSEETSHTIKTAGRHAHSEITATVTWLITLNLKFYEVMRMNIIDR